MIIGGMQKTSTIDFPGVLSCVLFTRGCNLDCFYCHNRNLIASSGDCLTEDVVMSFLEKRRGLLEGVTISGGEPTLQQDLLIFLRKVKEMGYLVKLDTNGQKPETVSKLCREGLLDYAAVDLKALKEDYNKVCGEDGYAAVIETINFLQESEIGFEVRTTLYPGMTIDELRKLFAGAPRMPRWRLNYFRLPKEYKLQDEYALKKESLTVAEIEKNLPLFLYMQPNLIWD
ncbi:MAG: anaerobic ribonucleoside-triphosphate reductase activating protein [Acholeplasmataceae bacterium]|nr:anaerobic ribonucleoside-triphosphate reductase activating protein [Acholeplasmataceae bacterium]